MKGSQKAILELIEASNHLDLINKLIQSTGANITTNDAWKPKGIKAKEEGTLTTFLKKHFDPKTGEDILSWWIKYGTVSPNWDFISTCTIDGKKGLLLVEAKAHKSELNKSRKALKKDASKNSNFNHDRIKKAIDEANIAINKEVDGVCISIDKCYQLSNRVAHAWWLADKGIPVVLLYLGFLNCDDMENSKRRLFKKDEDWQSAFIEYAKLVGVDKIMDKWIKFGESKFKIISRSVNR